MKGPNCASRLLSTPRRIWAQLNAFTRTLLIINALGVAIVALLGYIVSRIGLRPVECFSKEARILPRGPPWQRSIPPRVARKKLLQLASSFNGVLERQEIARRQLVNADVDELVHQPDCQTQLNADVRLMNWKSYWLKSEGG